MSEQLPPATNCDTGEPSLLERLIVFYNEQAAQTDAHCAKLGGALEENPDGAKTPAVAFDLGRVEGERTVLSAFAAFVMAHTDRPQEGELTVAHILQQSGPEEIH